MSFPYEFSRSNGDYDFVSGPMNFMGNAGMVVVGGLALATIVYVAMKALGIGQAATLTVTAVPIAASAIAVVGFALAGLCLLYVLQGVGEALGHR